MNRNALRLAVAAAVVPAVAAGYLHLRNPVIGEAHAAAGTPAVTYFAALPDFSGLVAQAGPAVVAIRVTQTMHNAGFQGLPPGIGKNSPFFDFFRHFGVPPGSGGDETMQGIGSGFVVSSDGHILTNAHVVADADEVDVRLIDKREFIAKVIGVDRKSDIAMIKIDARDLPTLRIGDANALKVGEWVVAIGSPFGLENTVTAGVVSAKARALPDDSYVPFIQTDVAVNPGNSGGPLLNMKGEVVGINSQIFSRSGGYMGLSFAIPIDVALKVGGELREHGKVERGRLGVSVQSMTQELAQSFNLDNISGALVSEVEKGSPAAKAGLQAGDVILGVNGRDIGDSVALARLIADLKPGDTALLRILHNGEQQTVQSKVGESPSEQIADADDTNAKPDGGRLGVAVRSLDADELRQLDEKGGVFVEQVSGAAAKAGIQPGDVILAINNERINSPEQLKSLVAHARSHVALLVKRDEAAIYVPVALG
jgi:serine protease Do